jgi:uncharacterized protein HemX
MATPFNRRSDDKWHVGKEIPIVLIMAVLAQTAGGIWWMSQMSSKIDNAVLSIAEIKTERYTREDARRDRELIEQKIKTMETRDSELERRINSSDSRLDRVERK